MAFSYTFPFAVRGYEVGYDGVVAPSVYVNYFEEAATLASASYGFDLQWYLSRNEFWVVRRLHVRYCQPAEAFQPLALTTWISDIRRVSSSREYDLRRASDNAQIARARHDWVYVDASAMRPVRVPPQFTDHFAPDTEIPDLDVGIAPEHARSIENPRVFANQRRTSWDELDLLGHVNNAVYIRWCDNAVIETLRAVGVSPKTMTVDGVQLQLHGREIDYRKGAHDADPIHLTTQLALVSDARAQFETEIRLGESGDMLAVDKLTYSFTRDGQPCPPPDSLIRALSNP